MDPLLYILYKNLPLEKNYILISRQRIVYTLQLKYMFKICNLLHYNIQLIYIETCNLFSLKEIYFSINKDPRIKNTRNLIHILNASNSEDMH